MMSKLAKLHINGSEYELPIVEGSVKFQKNSEEQKQILFVANYFLELISLQI